jgi:hypothetical protein
MKLNDYIPQLIDLVTKFFAKEEAPKDEPTSQIEPASQVHTLKLTRTEYRADGIFSVLAMDGQVICFTLEHAYLENGSYVPKISNGIHRCVKGQHQLEHMKEPFTTYEILQDGHTDLLFHVGNFNRDSSGCCLMGQHIIDWNGVKSITNSQDAFTSFMKFMAGVEEFSLVVSS